MAAYHYQQGDRPLDGYTIQYALGRGGFGEVYFAVSDSGREVALKAVQNFEDVELRGIGHCMNLKSPHLVMIFDVKRAADGTPWVIMEYVSGPSLRDILDEAPDGLDTEQALFFLRELAKGLSYLHEAGVVHRDLKPHNVFFEDGIVKIGDYSLSKVITTSHRSGNTMTVGSVHYMAPEISLGRYDKTVDIYALGVLLHEMLTGQPPYVGESMGEVLMKHLSSDPDVSGLPEPFAGAICKAMQRDPADRFQSAEDMIKAISGAEAEKPLDDSFNPTTLSLVGERAQQTKAERTAEQTIAASVSHRSTTPTAAVDVQTSQYQPAIETPTALPRRGLLSRIGLHYTPAATLHELPDPLPWHTRLLLAWLATFVLIGIGTAFEPDVTRDWDGILAFTIGTMSIAIVGTSVCRRWLPFEGRVWPGIVARFGWAVSAGLTAFLLLNLIPHNKAEQCAPVVLALIVATCLPDLRCLIAADRTNRISPLLTLMTGIVAAVIGAWIEVRWDIHMISAAVAMAAAISVQLLAPFRQAAPDAPPNRVSGLITKPRLLYDGPAMLLELVAGACFAFIIGVVMNIRDETAWIVLGLPAFLVGGFALRFRLHRRAWPKQPDAPPFGTRSTKAVAGAVVFDWVSVFLELLIAVSVISLTAMMIEGDDDMVPVGAAVAILGTLALRFRLQRRRTAAAAAATATTRPRLSFDGLSVCLELVTGACVATIFAVLFEGDDDLFFMAAAAAAVGITALRFRMARRLVAKPVQDNSPLPEYDQKTDFRDAPAEELRR